MVTLRIHTFQLRNWHKKRAEGKKLPWLLRDRAENKGRVKLISDWSLRISLVTVLGKGLCPTLLNSKFYYNMYTNREWPEHSKVPGAKEYKEGYKEL